MSFLMHPNLLSIKKLLDGEEVAELTGVTTPPTDTDQHSAAAKAIEWFNFKRTEKERKQLAKLDNR